MPGIHNVEVEPALVRRLMRGEEAVQEQIYRLYSKPVYTMAYRVVGNKETAEDVTQEVFIDILTKASTLKDPTAFNGWVQRITMNRCRMALRSAWFRRRADVPIEDLNIETKATVNEDTITASKAFAALPSKTRLVLWLYCVEGFTHNEIAKWLGRSPSYSKSIVNRAGKHFESHYKSNEVDAECLTLLHGTP